MDVRDLNSQLQSRLHAAEVYDVDTYGWRNENEEDPEYIGFVMWTIDAPYEHASIERQDGRPPTRKATSEQQRLIELGEDFHGVMKAARQEIGLVLFYADDAIEHRNLESRFEYHVISSLVLLKIAADRARDFFIVAVLDELPDMNHEFDQFRLAVCAAEQRGAGEVARELQKISQQTQDLRRRRNAVVHKVTMDITRVHKYLVEEERQAYEKQKWPRRRPDRGKIDRDMNATVAFDEAAAKRDIESAVERLIGDYKAVIKAGDLAFRAEHSLRPK